MRRYAARRDANEGKVVAALRAIGCSVIRLDAVDLLVGRAGQNWLIEVKDGSKPPSARKLTPAQKTLRNDWRGQYSVVTSPLEAVELVNRMGKS